MSFVWEFESTIDCIALIYNSMTSQQTPSAYEDRDGIIENTRTATQWTLN